VLLKLKNIYTFVKINNHTMKKHIVLLILAIVAGVWASDARAASKKVAVYVEGTSGNSARNIVNSAMTTRLAGDKNYIVYERSDDFVSALTREQDYQLSGEVPDSQIRKVGERMGVDVVIVVQVSESEDAVDMNARMIDLESGRVLKSVSGSRNGSGAGVLRALANNCAFRLLSKQSK